MTEKGKRSPEAGKSDALPSDPPLTDPPTGYDDGFFEHFGVKPPAAAPAEKSG